MVAECSKTPRKPKKSTEGAKGVRGGSMAIVGTTLNRGVCCSERQGCQLAPKSLPVNPSHPWRVKIT